MELNNIYNQDCLLGMEMIAKEGTNIDLIVADPPYCISKESNFHTMKDRRIPRTGTYFGDWDKDFDNKPWIEKSYNILKKGGSLLVFNSSSGISTIIDYAESAGFVYKDTLVWQKTNPMPRNRDRRYVPNIELIVWLVKPGKWTFNRQKDPYEGCVIQVASESGGGKKRYHPTQKPIKLVEHLIKIHSNENEIVLDPFMGGGTTALACINTDRQYLGFETDRTYYNASIERIKGYE